MPTFPAPTPPGSTVGGRSRSFWLWLALALVAVAALIVFAPVFAAVVGLLAFLVGLVLLVVRLLRRGKGRPRRTGALRNAVVVTVAGFLVLCIGAVVDTPATGGAGTTAVEAAEPSSSQEALADRIGRQCEDEREVVSLADETVYCDEDEAGSLVWVSAATHAATQKKVAAEKAAAAKAEAEKAAEKAAAEKAAAEKAAAEKAAKKAAEQKAAAKQAAKAKAKAEAKKVADQKAAAEKAAAAEAKQAAASQAAAEREAEQQAATEQTTSGSSAYYANCTAVRAAGAAPLHTGDAGYSRKLDRDGDGVACE